MKPLTPKPQKHASDIPIHVKSVAIGVFICAMILTLLVTSFVLANRIKDFSFTRASDSTWSFTQVEVAYLRFQNELSIVLDATPVGAPIPTQYADSLVRSFDIFYSRLDTLTQRPSTYQIPKDILLDLEQIYQLRDDLATIVDNNHPYTRNMISALLQLTNSKSDQVRHIILHALQFSVDEQDAARGQLNASLYRFLLIATILLLLSSITSISMMYLFRENRFQSREQLRISSYLFNVVEASQNAIIVLNENLEISEFNTAAEEMFACDREDASGLSIIDNFTPPRWQNTFRTRLQSLLSDTDFPEAGFINARVRAQRANGDPFPAELTIVRESGINAEKILIGFLRDTSEEMEARSHAKEALAQAQSDAAAKSRFLATMSHEMRTPLHGVIASLDMIDIDTQSTETAKYISIAREASTAALEQTEDVLDATKQATSSLIVVPTHYNAKTTLQQIANQVSALSQSRGNTMTIQWSGPENNFGSRRCLSKSIYNLLSNAIKFTENGTISIRGQNKEIDGILMTHVEVTDTGVGIDKENIEHIFEDFYSNTKSTGGTLSSTGLGLGIAKHCAKSLGGDIGYTSEAGIGSTFWISFPAQMQQPEVAEKADAKSQPDWSLTRDKTALIIEDHPTNRELIALMAKRLGYHVETAADGIEGLQKAYSTSFDLILTDVSMPRLDGINTSSCIRLMSASKNACIVAVTAHGAVETDETSSIFDHGIDGLISKPFTQVQLKTRLFEILEERIELNPQSENQDNTASFNVNDFADIGLPEADKNALIQRTHADITQVQSDLKTALAHFEPETLKSLAASAHHAAGAIYFLGCAQFGDTLIEIEKKAKDENQTALIGLQVLVESGLQTLSRLTDIPDSKT